MQTHNIVMSIMALNFVFWITFGTLSFFVYLFGYEGFFLWYEKRAFRKIH
mgnify:CR=1 FL=1